MHRGAALGRNSGAIPLMRLVMAEVYRYVVSLTKVKHVSAAHGIRGAALVVVLRWA
jgi:hypothetical protein